MTAVAAEARVEPVVPRTNGMRPQGHSAVSLFVVFLLAAAALIYRPWDPAPLPVRDFSAYLPTFTSGVGAFEAWSIQMREYAGEGRFFPLTLAPLVGAWWAWDWNVVGWQWTRFLLMVAVPLVFVPVARRYGATRAGAVAGATLFVVSGAAGSAWLMPQVWDAIAVLAVLGALWHALGFAASATPTRSAIVIALHLAVAALVVETFVVAVPFVMAVLMCRRADASFGPPRLDRRIVTAVGINAAILTVLVAAPVVYVMLNAATDAYSTRYGAAGMSAGRVGDVVTAMVLPVTRTWWFPANVAFAGVLLLGWWAGRGATRAGIGWALAAPLALIGASIVVYLPWPALPGYYGYKALPGLAIILALAVSRLPNAGALPQLAGAAGLAAMLAFGALIAANSATRYRAQMVVDARAAIALAATDPAAPVVAAVPDPALSGNLGAALLRYGHARASLPVDRERDISDISCERAFDRIGEPVIVVALSSAGCAVPASAAAAPAGLWTSRFASRSPRSWMIVPDSTVAALWLPRASMNRSSFFTP